MSGLRLIPLTCPECAAPLRGARWDKLFSCMECALSFQLGADPSPRYELAFAAPAVVADAPVIHLPVWRLDIESRFSFANHDQERAVEKLGPVPHVWVTAFLALRPAYFGDLGLLLTENRVPVARASARPAGTAMAGITRELADARRYARLFVTLMIDKRADVTGMAIDVAVTGASIWAIPFADEGDVLKDLLLGRTYPAFSVDDIEDIRRISKR